MAYQSESRLVSRLFRPALFGPKIWSSVIGVKLRPLTHRPLARDPPSAYLCLSRRTSCHGPKLGGRTEINRRASTKSQSGPSHAPQGAVPALLLGTGRHGETAWRSRTEALGPRASQPLRSGPC